AITALYRLYFKQVVRVSAGIVKDHDVAKDIAQELFIRIWEKRRKLSFHGSFQNYLMRSAINQSLYYLRNHKKGDQLKVFVVDNLIISDESPAIELDQLKELV